jgi:phage terminase Nu1 subunit (DNA packaging protein)
LPNSSQPRRNGNDAGWVTRILQLKPHRKKNPTGESELSLTGINKLPAAIPAFARAEKFSPITDAGLRNILKEKTPGGSPWFPAPANSLWDVRAVISGLHDRSEHRISQRSGFPLVFATQEDFENATTLPRSILQFLRKKGHQIILPGGRVDFSAVLKAIAHTKLEKTDYIDGDYEDKRLTRERADEQAMLNAEKRGEVLFNADQTFAISELSATEILYGQFLEPLKKELFEKAKSNPITYEDLTALFEKYNRQLPPEIPAPQNPPAK